MTTNSKGTSGSTPIGQAVVSGAAEPPPSLRPTPATGSKVGRGPTTPASPEIGSGDLYTKALLSPEFERVRQSAHAKGLAFLFLSHSNGDGRIRHTPYIGSSIKSIPEFELLDQKDSAIYYSLPNSLAPKLVGTLSSCNSPQSPLTTSFLDCNEMLAPANKELLHRSYPGAAAASLSFRHGIGVTKDTNAAASFASQIPEKQRPSAYGEVLTKALIACNLPLALACIPLSEGVRSMDESGNYALLQATSPELAQVLRKLLSLASEDDLQFLKAVRQAALRDGSKKAAEDIESRANNLGYTLE